MIRPPRLRLIGCIGGWLLACSSIVQAAPAKPAPAAGPSGAERVALAVTQTQSDIKASLAELNQTRDQVAGRRSPLVDRRDVLEREVRDLRLEVERMRAQRRDRENARQQLDEVVFGLESEAGLGLAALQEYRRSMETRLGPAKPADVEAALTSADSLLTSAEDFGSLGAATEALLGLAARLNQERLGGTIFAGVCLDETGREHTGQLLGFGPLVYFFAEAGSVAGEVGRRAGNLEPALSGDRLQDTKPIAAIVAGGEADLPVDPTGGDALRLKQTHESIGQRLRSGGVTMIPLGVVGLLAAWLTIAKFTAFSRIHPPSPEALNPVVDRVINGDIAGARAAADAIGAPFSEILREGIEHRTASVENLEEILHERVLGILPTLDRHLGILAVLGGLAPLLGLLGTVGGMIHTFQAIAAFGLGDTKLLSSGIAEAMVATQVGLGIAIPVVLVHAYLSRRLRMIVTALEQTVAAFVNRVTAPVSAKDTP